MDQGTPELRLIAKLVETGEMQRVLDSGITEHSFASVSEARDMYRYIFTFYTDRITNGEVPTLSHMQEQYPGYDIPDVESRVGIGSCIDALTDSVLRREMAALNMDLTLAMDEQRPHESIPHLQQKMNELMAIRSPSTDLILSSETDRVVSDYMDRKVHKGLTGIPWPWETLNEETLGIQNNEFTVLYGRPKSMKTWLLLTIGVHAYNAANRKVLIYTREMHPNQILDRCACLLAGVPYGMFRKGRLNELPGEYGGTMEEDFLDALANLKHDEITCTNESGHHKGIIVTSDRASKKGGGVAGLRAKIKSYEPDLILVDGIYLMRNDRVGKRSVGWENMTDITQDLHDVCLDSKRPLIGTTQANRASEQATEKTMANIAHSDSFAQDCDLAINVIRPRTDDPLQSELDLIVTGAREFDLYGFVTNGIPASDFTQKKKPIFMEDGTKAVDENGRVRWEDIVYLNEYQRIEYRGDMEEKRKNNKPERGVDRVAEARKRFSEANRERDKRRK